MKADPLILMVVILIAVFSVLLIILAWGDLHGGDWQLVAQGVASFIVYIVVLAIVVGTIWALIRRR